MEVDRIDEVARVAVAASGKLDHWMRASSDSPGRLGDPVPQVGHDVLEAILEHSGNLYHGFLFSSADAQNIPW